MYMEKAIQRPRRKLPNLRGTYPNAIEESLQKEIFRNLNNSYNARLRKDKIEGVKYKRFCIICRQQFETDIETRVRCLKCYHSTKVQKYGPLIIIPSK